jgi:hypothetical protein
MARALQCPSCGTMKQLDGMTADTFRCEECGQVLKVPAGARSGGGAPGTPAAPPRRRPSPSSTAAVPDGPAPPRRTTGAPAPVVATPPTATASRGAAPPRDRGGGGSEPPPPARKPPRSTLPLWIRIGAWVLAVPIGLALVGIPARALGYLTSQKLLDVFVKHTLSRFVPLLVIVVLWALATTILVEILVEGGRWIMLHRQRGVATADLQSFDAPPSQSRRSRRRGA